MDYQKTGELIAGKRKELGMTQKMLAEKLHISDRTVSKWERGVGFPDISLIEPLADALGLSVLEIFHGQRETSLPEAEHSARETLNICKPELEKTVRQSRRWLLGMGILLLALITALPWLISSAHGKWMDHDSITPQEAVEISSEILISTADYAFLERVTQDKRIIHAYRDRYAQSVFLESENCKNYRSDVKIMGNEPLFLDIYVSFESITIKYGTQYVFVSISIDDGIVSKQVILHEYPYLTESGQNIPMGQRHGKRIDLLNKNNETFQKSGYRTGWLELFRPTYY